MGIQGIPDGHRHVYLIFHCLPVSAIKAGGQIPALYLPSRKHGTTTHAKERKGAILHHESRGKLPSNGRPRYLPDGKSAVHQPIYKALYHPEWMS